MLRVSYRARVGRSQLFCGRDDITDTIVAMSFDDGPSKWTPPILEHLARHGARATFFVCGKWIADWGPTLRRAVTEGHEIGNHSMTHPDLTTLTPDRIKTEIAETTLLLDRAVKTAPRLFRPPFLGQNDVVLDIAGSLGFEHTIGTAGPEDYNIEQPEQIVADVFERYVKPGSIIALHDAIPPNEPLGASLPTRQQTVTAVGEILKRLSADGYRVVTVSELVGR